MSRENLKFTVQCLGPAGTFSEAATLGACAMLGLDSAGLVLKPGIPATAELPVGGIAVLPYYNLLEGVVQESLDGIAYNNLKVVALMRLPIVFYAGRSATDAPATAVHSHPKALGQCSEFIAAHFATLPVVSVTSTAASAEAAAKNPGVIAIAARKAIEANNLRVVGADVGNCRYGRQNFTDFLVTCHADSMPTALRDLPATHTLLLVAPEFDEPGILAGVCHALHWHQLNLTKIHSRPSPVSSSVGKGEPQAFYMELDCSPDDARLALALASISGRLRDVAGASVRILGGFSIHPVKE